MITRQVVQALQGASWLSEDRSNVHVDELIEEATRKGGPLDSTWLPNLTEFGRDVHAEMSAIVSAARRGVRVDGATLVCTTFPCHGCAKHILAAGIRRVVYIEPYAKSFAVDFHDDAIALDERDGGDGQRVPFSAFVGVAPRHYGSWFAMTTRKDGTGQVVEFEPTKALPWFRHVDPGYVARELSVLDSTRSPFNDAPPSRVPGGNHEPAEI